MHDVFPSGSEDTERQKNIEVWNDLVSPAALLTCLAISVTCAVIAVVASSVLGGQTLFWGLGASVLGFAVNCVLVTPQREVLIVGDLEDLDDAQPQGDAHQARAAGASAGGDR